MLYYIAFGVATYVIGVFFFLTLFWSASRADRFWEGRDEPRGEIIVYRNRHQARMRA